MSNILSRILLAIEIMLFVLSIIFNCSIYLASLVFPGGSSWLNTTYFLISVLCWVSIAVLLVGYRDNALTALPRKLVVAVGVAVLFFISNVFFGSLNLLLTITLFGVIGMVLVGAPAFLGFHLLWCAYRRTQESISYSKLLKRPYACSCDDENSGYPT